MDKLIRLEKKQRKDYDQDLQAFLSRPKDIKHTDKPSSDLKITSGLTILVILSLLLLPLSKSPKSIGVSKEEVLHLI